MPSSDVTIDLVARVLAKRACAMRADPNARMTKSAQGDWLSGVGKWWGGLNPYAKSGIVGAGLGGLTGFAASRAQDPRRRNTWRDTLTGALAGGSIGLGATAAREGIQRFVGPEAEERQKIIGEAQKEVAKTKPGAGEEIASAGLGVAGDVITNPYVAGAALGGGVGVAREGLVSQYGGVRVDPGKALDPSMIQAGARAEVGVVQNQIAALQQANPPDMAARVQALEQRVLGLRNLADNTAVARQAAQQARAGGTVQIPRAVGPTGTHIGPIRMSAQDISGFASQGARAIAQAEAGGTVAGRHPFAWNILRTPYAGRRWHMAPHGPRAGMTLPRAGRLGAATAALPLLYYLFGGGKDPEAGQRAEELAKQID